MTKKQSVEKIVDDLCETIRGGTKTLKSLERSIHNWIRFQQEAKNKKDDGKKEGKEQQESGRAESPATDSLE